MEIGDEGPELDGNRAISQMVQLLGHTYLIEVVQRQQSGRDMRADPTR